MRHLLSFTLLIAVFIGTYHLFEQQSATTQKATINIGVTLPLSGTSAETGLVAQDAVNLALKDWSNRSTRYKYRIFYLDDAGSDKQAGINAQNLIDKQKADAVLSMWSPSAIAIAPLAVKNKIIHFTCAFGGKVSDGQYNFNHYLSYHTDKFISDFQEKTGKLPSSCSSNLYDALNLLIFAYENASPDHETNRPATDGVVRNLHKLSNHQTASGAIMITPEGTVQPSK